MTKENALHLIRMTVFEFHRDVMIPLNANIDLYDKMPHSSAVRLHEHFFDFSSAVQNLYGEISKAIMEDMDNFQTSQLLSLCRNISELYSLPVFKDMPGSIPDNSPIRYVDPGATDDLNYGSEDNTLEKLKSQIRKFGDEELTKRLAEVESGQSRIVFEEMKDSTEGHTVFDNGKVTYRLNKKYEKASDEADLWKASIILAHELQRNPATGDLRGETAEIVMRDLSFIEKLVAEYGEKVYEQLPEFELLDLIKERCGEERLRKFIDMAFNHEGNYYDVQNRRRGRGVTGFLLRLLLGSENYDRVFGDPMLDGFFDFSNRILHAAVEFPAQVISWGADIVRFIAINNGNLPLGVVAGEIGTAADFVRLGSYALRAYDGDIEARNEFGRLSASMGIKAFVGWSVRQDTAHVRVIRSTKNGGYYQKGRCGRLSNIEGLHRMIMQELSPIMRGEGSARIADLIIGHMIEEFGNE